MKNALLNSFLRLFTFFHAPYALYICFSIACLCRYLRMYAKQKKDIFYYFYAGSQREITFSLRWK